MPDEIKDWISRKATEYGGSILRMRFGAGVLGRTGTIAGAFIVLCLLGMIELPGVWKLAPLGLGFLAFAMFQIGSLIFATKHPMASVLEGTNLVTTYLQDAKAKEMPAVIEGQIVKDPLAPPVDPEEVKQIKQAAADA